MPGKDKTKYGDDYESDDLEATDTLISRNQVPTTPKKKIRPASGSAKKRTPRRPGTPGSKKKKRPSSAPSARTGHDLWMNAVKQRLTVGLASNRHPQSPRHKSASEYWIDTLRKTGLGFTTESTGMNTFSGKRPRDKDMPYLSTPSYLRQVVGTERPSKGVDPTVKASPGTPAYKSQEEYYEQILEYKKQLSAMNQESSNMKAKIRRLEEDNLKKEKEIDVLLNPQKSEELRRTLTDKRPDSGSVIHSLKQKILKLETQMRDKESAYIKLQSDLKTTKIEEMKQQMEVFYNEIVRLQNSKDTDTDKSGRITSRQSDVKVKALNETILRLNKSNELLQTENRSLKEDLKNAMDDHGGQASTRDYEDMNRKELLKTLVQMEKKLERAEKHMDSSSIISYDSKAPHVQGKVALTGSLQERLDQLDKRESELLEMLEAKNEKLKQLTAEKNRWKKRCEEMERLMGSGKEYDHRSDDRPRQSRPASARTQDTVRSRPPSAHLEDRPPTAARERTPRGSTADRKDSRAGSADRKRRPSIDSGISSVRRQKIQAFTENRSAKTIQRHWKSHRNDQKRKQDQLNKDIRESERAVTRLVLEQSKGQSAAEFCTPRSSSGSKQTDVNLGSHRASSVEPGKPKFEKTNSMELADDEIDLGGSRIQNEKVQHFKENRAAKKIQHQWTGYRHKKVEAEQAEAADLIRASLMGHSARRQQMAGYHTETEDDDYETDNEDYNACVNLIQSSMLGHQQRKNMMKDFSLSSTGEEDYDDDDDTYISENQRRPLSSSQRSYRPPSPSVQRSRPSSGKSRGSVGSIKGSISNASYKSRDKGKYSSHLDDDDF